MISAYCWPQSAVATQFVEIFCSSQVATAKLEVCRQGVEERIVLTQIISGLSQQAVPADVAVQGCNWQASHRLEIDPEWQSGFYLVRLTALETTTEPSPDASEVAEAFFVVRSIKPLDALLVLSTSTWAAYNNWGGPSFYTGGHTSSLRRPLPKGFLSKQNPHQQRMAFTLDWTESDIQNFRQLGYSSWSMAAGWANWELLFVQWAESQGYELGFATSADLHSDPSLFAGYNIYLSVGHDEYWTKNMRDQIDDFVLEGGNAAFFSGNTAFWQARFNEDCSQLVCYKMALQDDPYYQPHQLAGGLPELSTMWSDPLVGRPENQMTGVSFTRGGYAHMNHSPRGSGGYTVHDSAHWVFDSVELDVNNALGVEGYVVAYECDGCEFTLHNGKRIPTGKDGTPTDMQILATAPARLWETYQIPSALDESYVGELNWVAERIAGEDSPDNRMQFDEGHAVIGYFNKGRGQVFTAGCTDWAYGLGLQDISTVTKNVIDRFRE